MRKFNPINQTTSINYSTGKKKRRDFGTFTVNNICETCNSGWMSRLQDLAKPHIAPLLTTTTWSPLSAEAPAVISNWAVMTSMVCEATHPRKLYGVSPHERAAFAANQTAASGWQVWIGRSHHTPNRGYTHWPWVTLDDADSPVIPLDVDSTTVPVGQYTIMLFGKLIVLALSGHHPPLQTDTLPSWGMLKLWPEVDVTVNPPPTEFPAQYHERVLFDVLHGKLVSPLGFAHRPSGTMPIHHAAGLSNRS